jgi:hypothetical protein
VALHGRARDRFLSSARPLATHTSQLTRDTTRGHRLGETSPVNTRRRHHRQSGAERTRKAVGTHMRRRRPPLKIHALRPRTLPCAPPYLVPCALISGCTSRHSHHHTAAPPSVNASSAKHPLGNLPRTLPEAAAKGGGIAARGIAARGIAARVMAARGAPTPNLLEFSLRSARQRPPKLSGGQRLGSGPSSPLISLSSPSHHTLPKRPRAPGTAPGRCGDKSVRGMGRQGSPRPSAVPPEPAEGRGARGLRGLEGRLCERGRSHAAVAAAERRAWRAREA